MSSNLAFPAIANTASLEQGMNSHVPSLHKSPLAKLHNARLIVMPKIGRAWASMNHHINHLLVRGIGGLEQTMRKSTEADVDGIKRIQSQRAKAIKVLSIMSKITDLGVLASAIAGIMAPPAQWATMSLALITLSLRKVQGALLGLVLDAHKSSQNPNEPLKADWCIKAAQLMKGAGVKYLPTAYGLMTATDLSLHSYGLLQTAKRRGQLSDQAITQWHTAVEGQLRRILAGKANHRDHLALLGMIPQVNETSRVSANFVRKSFGHVGQLIPLDESQRDRTRPNDPTVVGLLQGSDYSSQSVRPELGYTLRNLVWGPARNQADWVNLIQAHIKADGAITLSAKDQAVLQKSGVNIEQTQKYLNKPLKNLISSALNTLVKSDQRKLDAGQLDDLSPSGAALVYTAHSVIRKHTLACGLSKITDIAQLNTNQLREIAAQLPV